MLVQQESPLITSYCPFYSILGFGLQPQCYYNCFLQAKTILPHEAWKKKWYRNIYARGALDSPVSCTGVLRASHFPWPYSFSSRPLGDVWFHSNVVPTCRGWCFSLTLQSLISNSNNVTGITRRAMKERNTVTPRIYTPSTASISFLSF